LHQRKVYTNKMKEDLFNQFDYLILKISFFAISVSVIIYLRKRNSQIRNNEDKNTKSRLFHEP
jgi:hypothetical protein